MCRGSDSMTGLIKVCKIDGRCNTTLAASVKELSYCSGQEVI